jgi:PAS domain S-box-containing protein
MDNLFLFNYFTLPILAAFLIACILAFLASGKGNTRGQAFLALTMSALAIYNFFYFLELNVLTVESKVQMLKMQYVGGVFISPFVWLFVKKFTSGKPIPITTILGIIILPVLNLMGVLTNSIHGGFFSDARLIDGLIGYHQFLSVENGIVYYVHSAYSFLLTGHAFIIITKGFLSARGREKSQVGLAFGAFLVSFASYIVLLTGALPEFFDPLAFTFSITGILLYIAITKFGLLNNLPIAYKTLFNHLKDAVLVFDQGLYLSYFNVAATKTFDIDSAAIGMKSEDLFEDYQHFKDWISAQGKEEESKTEFEKVKHPLSCFQVTYRKLKYGDASAGYMLIFNDISEKKRYLKSLEETNKHLEANDRRFRSIVDNANDIIFILEPSGQFSYLSPNWEIVLGQIPRDWENKHFLDLIHPDDIEDARQIFSELRTSEASVRGKVFRTRKKGGTYQYQEFNASRMVDENGKLVGIVGVGRDVTEDIESRKKLEASEKQAINLAHKYQNILENESVFFLRINRAAEMIYANSCFQKLFFSDKIPAHKFLETLIPADRKKLPIVLENCFQNPGDPINVISRHLDFTGSERGIKWEFKSVTADQENTIEVLALGVEITEQLNTLKTTSTLLQTTSRQNEKLKDFTYIISHNIRSHAANFLGLIDVLKRIELTSEEAQTFLDHIETTALRLDETLHHLGKVVSIQEESQARGLDNCLLKSYVEKSLKIFEKQLSEIKASVTIDIGDDCYVKAIPSYLESIFLNIISNAVKYRSPGRKLLLSISATKKEEFVSLYFCDNGLGLDISLVRKKIFGMYQTFHGNEDARGLGLFITRAQVESMGGEIDVKGKSGEGCCFVVDLKLA